MSYVCVSVLKVDIRSNNIMAFITGPFPIDWFGNRKAYNKSPLKVVTVGINPSCLEFGENPVYPNLERFPNAGNSKKSQEKAFDEYFSHKPLGWFNSYEDILNGLGATYYPSKEEYSVKAIHTDLCSPFATFPTWTILSGSDKEALVQGGVPQWENLIKVLKPHVIIAALKVSDLSKLNLVYKCDLMQIAVTKNGLLRKIPRIVKVYDYHGIIFINGWTFNTPFGDISKQQRKAVGQAISKILP